MIKPSFSGHETFALRHGWLEKAFFAVSNNPNNPFTQQMQYQSLVLVKIWLTQLNIGHLLLVL